MLNVTEAPYNADPTGVTDARSAIEDAIDDCVTAGGGVVYLPAGTYLLDSQGSKASTCLDVGGDNVYLRGDGVGATKLVLGDGVDCHAVDFTDTVWGGLSGIEIDGNGANQTAGHGIRLFGVTNLNIHDFWIHDAVGYGIGMQGGTNKGNRIHDGIIDDSGVDGFDAKNLEDNNGVNYFYNVKVDGFGQAEGTSNCAGVDFRGVWIANNIEVTGYGAGAVAGIRFRDGEAGNASGLGGHNSKLTNFYVSHNDDTYGTFGLAVSAYACQISNGQVLGMGEGVMVHQHENQISNVLASGCRQGFHLEKDAGMLTMADRTVLSGCVARSNSEIGFNVETDYCVLDGVVARSNTVTGIVIRSSANKTYVTGVSTGNGTNFDNSGTNTVSSVQV